MVNMKYFQVLMRNDLLDGKNSFYIMHPSKYSEILWYFLLSYNSLNSIFKNSTRAAKLEYFNLPQHSRLHI